MAVIDIFSKRRKLARGETPDVYTYDNIPTPLRVQIVHVLRDLFGHRQDYDLNNCLMAFGTINKMLSREYGEFSLSDTGHFADDQVVDFVLSNATCDQVLDVVEMAFRWADIWLERGGVLKIDRKSLGDAIEEMNARFREHGIGYQYESWEIIRVDSQLIHSEVVVPVLSLLSSDAYAGANEEFLKAFEHYRKGDTKECLNECLKALESTMKAISKKRGWSFKETDTAAALIDICYKNGLVPPLIQSHIGGVRAALESGIPTVRNRLSGHGQGTTVTTVPPHYASYMLHLTATTIKFLVESEKALT
jgi:Domain of unknown function (DUF7014)/AbiJ N-terminal domain 4